MSLFVVCLGLGRSGSTLQYLVSRKLLELDSKCHDHGYTKREAAISAAFRRRTRREHDIVKAHACFDCFSELSSCRDVRFLCSVRDFESVCLSFMRLYGLTFDYIIEHGILDQEIARFKRISGLNPLLIQNYEKLKLNLPSAVAQIAGFLEVGVTRESASEVAREFSVESQRKRVEQYNSTLRAKMIRAINDIFRAVNPTRYRPVGLLVNRDARTGMFWNHISDPTSPMPQLTEEQKAIVRRKLAEAEIVLPRD